MRLVQTLPIVLALCAGLAARQLLVAPAGQSGASMQAEPVTDLLRDPRAKRVVLSGRICLMENALRIEAAYHRNLRDGDGDNDAEESREARDHQMEYEHVIQDARASLDGIGMTALACSDPFLERLLPCLPGGFVAGDRFDANCRTTPLTSYVALARALESSALR